MKVPVQWLPTCPTADQGNLVGVLTFTLVSVPMTLLFECRLKPGEISSMSSLTGSPYCEIRSSKEPENDRFASIKISLSISGDPSYS